MPKLVIEREIPGAGEMTDEEIRASAMKAMEAVRAIGPQVQWLHSYVTANQGTASQTGFNATARRCSSNA